MFFLTVLLNNGFEASPAAVHGLQLLFSLFLIFLLFVILGSERWPALRQGECPGERAL